MNRFSIIYILSAIFSLNSLQASVASGSDEKPSQSDANSRSSVSSEDMAGYKGAVRTLTAAASSPTLERRSSAIKAWNEYKEFSDQADPNYLASAATNLGNMGEKVLANEAWRTLLARRDLKYRTLSNAGITLSLQGEYEIARLAFKALITAEDNSPGSHHALFEAAEFLYERGEIRLARKMWKKYLNHGNLNCTDLYDAAQYFKREIEEVLIKKGLSKKDLSKEEFDVLSKLERLEIKAWTMLNEKLQSMPAEGNEPLRAEVEQALAELTP